MRWHDVHVLDLGVVYYFWTFCAFLVWNYAFSVGLRLCFCVTGHVLHFLLASDDALYRTVIRESV